jgi:hypothetical protein
VYLIGWLQPSMLVVPDVQDVYTPRQNDLLVPLIEVCVSRADLTCIVLSNCKCRTLSLYILQFKQKLPFTSMLESYLIQLILRFSKSNFCAHVL